MKKLNSLLIILLLLSIDTSAQLKISAELRPRLEFENGYKDLRKDGEDALIFVSQRSRLNFDYKFEKLKFRFVIQDIRHWGSTAFAANSDDNLSVHEAWAEYFFSDELSFKIGRQEMTYDDERILSLGKWIQQSRSHDAALLKYEGNFKAHLGAGFHEGYIGDIPEDIGKFYKSMVFLWLNKEFDHFNVSVLALNNGLQGVLDTVMSSETNYTQTIGTYTKINLNPFNFQISYYQQMGTDRYFRDLNAFNLSIRGSYDIFKGIKLTGGYEVLSGTDGDANSKINNSFTPFYSAGHKFNGYIDYFYAGNHFDNVGLKDVYFGTDLYYDKWYLESKFHYFNAFAKLLDSNSAEVAPYLGSELDLALNYKHNNTISLKLGYSQMFASKSMEVLKKGNLDLTNNWAYFMITIKPELFISTP